MQAPAKNEPIKGNPIPGIENIIAISSGKGGVGKSTVTANIAVTLAKMGFNIGILDADIYGPSIPTMLDMEGARPLSVNVNGASKMEPIENYGVKVLSIGFFTQPNQAVIWRGPMAAKALNQMIFDAAWGKLDFLLIDLPPGTGDIPSATCTMLGHVKQRGNPQGLRNSTILAPYCLGAPFSFVGAPTVMGMTNPRCCQR